MHTHTKNYNCSEKDAKEKREEQNVCARVGGDARKNPMSKKSS